MAEVIRMRIPRQMVVQAFVDHLHTIRLSEGHTATEEQDVLTKLNMVRDMPLGHDLIITTTKPFGQ